MEKAQSVADKKLSKFRPASCQRFECIALNAFEVTQDLENDSARFTQLILDVANRHAPRVRRRTRANTLPWIDRSPYMKKLMGLRGRLLKMSIPEPGMPADQIIAQL